MTKETEEKKQGLEHLSDETLACIVDESTNEGIFNNDNDAQAAFRELKRRTPEGLKHLSDETLAYIVDESTNEGTFNDDNVAQDAFRELKRRTPE